MKLPPPLLPIEKIEAKMEMGGGGGGQLHTTTLRTQFLNYIHI